MNITRRSFGKLTSGSLLALATGTSITLTGCNVFSDILSWIPVGITAINGILTVLGTLVPPGALFIISQVKSGFADLAAAVREYQADTNPADKSTLLEKIRTLLLDIVTNFQGFLNQLNLGTNTIVNIVIGLAQVVLSALMGFLGQLPTAPATSKRIAPVTFNVGGKQNVIVPHFYKTIQEFKSAYNSVATADGHPELNIK